MGPDITKSASQLSIDILLSANDCLSNTGYVPQILITSYESYSPISGNVSKSPISAL